MRFAVALYALLATVFCASVLPDPLRLALGHPGNDVWNHVWGYWWVAHAFAQGSLPMHTALLNWPAGGTLWFIDFFNAVLTLPVQWVAGPVAAYNASIWMNLVLCGVGAWMLARAVTGSEPGALLAGVAYMSAPHLLAQVYNGISETIAAGWLPLALMAAREAFRQPSAGRGALAGGLLGLTAVANWYYGLFAGVLVLGLFVRGVLRGAQRRFHLRRPGAKLAAVVAGALTAAAVAAVPFGLFYASMHASDALVTRDPGFVWMTLLMHNMTDVVTLVHPGRYYSPDLHAAFGEDLIVVVYLGAALWIPALYVVRTPQAAAARPWLLVFGFFVLLSLGPFLYVGGQYVSVLGGWLPLPFLALFQWFPMFSRISHAYRFTVGSTLALSVLVAFTVKAAARFRWSPARVAVGIGAARLVEVLFFSPAVFPVPASRVEVPAVYSRLGPGAVIDLPITMPVLARSRVLTYQIVHKQPVPIGLNDPVPLYLHRNSYTHYLVALERRTAMFLPPEIPDIDLAAGQADLVRRGCRWIVVHRDGYTADQYTRVARFLDLTAAAVDDDGSVRVYDLTLPPPGAAAPSR